MWRIIYEFNSNESTASSNGKARGDKAAGNCKVIAFKNELHWFRAGIAEVAPPNHSMRLNNPKPYTSQSFTLGQPLLKHKLLRQIRNGGNQKEKAY